MLRDELARTGPSTERASPDYAEPLLTRKWIAGYLKISLITLHDCMNKADTH